VNGIVRIGFCIVFALLLSTGVQGSDSGPAISLDGRYVTFDSGLTNLVPGDTNGAYDVFVRDRQTGTTYLVSRDSAGVEGNGYSDSPSISADGRYVAFQSSATNLVSGDTNGAYDVFVRDRTAGTTTRISKSSAGVEGNGYSDSPSISSDGRYVAFQSSATNLVSGDTNGMDDIFVRDRQTGTTYLVSRDSSGVEGDGHSDSPSISADGRYVAFYSGSTNLVTGDTNGAWDIFVRDRQTGTTTRVSRSSAGVEGDGYSSNPSISADGRYVTFESLATNLVSGDTNGKRDIFVRDRQTGTTTRVSKTSVGVEGDGHSLNPSISADGGYVTFDSGSTNLVSGDTNGAWDIFVRDRQTGTTTLVSRSSAGLEGDGSSFYPSISADGRYVKFESTATNLVLGDTNGYNDIFVRDRQTGTTTSVTVTAATLPNALNVLGYKSGDPGYWNDAILDTATVESSMNYNPQNIDGYASNVRETIKQLLPTEKIFLINAHGEPGRIKVNYQNTEWYYAKNSWPWEYQFNGFSSLEHMNLVVLLSCNSGSYSSEYGNLVDVFADKGAHCVMGWTDILEAWEVGVYNAKFWENIQQSKTINQAHIAARNAVKDDPHVYTYLDRCQVCMTSIVTTINYMTLPTITKIAIFLCLTVLFLKQYPRISSKQTRKKSNGLHQELRKRQNLFINLPRLQQRIFTIWEQLTYPMLT
jgi:Tol biopolymer transport system component